jgi:hypothetical protein
LSFKVAKRRAFFSVLESPLANLLGSTLKALTVETGSSRNPRATPKIPKPFRPSPIVYLV